MIPPTALTAAPTSPVRTPRPAELPGGGAGTPAGGVWEQRWHPLREEWVIVAAHRNSRPWSGETAERDATPPVAHDPDCPLCPGVTRVSGEENPEYRGVYVFDNDCPCVGEDAPASTPPSGVYRSRPASGIARVLCYSPRHDLSLAQMTQPEVLDLVRCWRDQYAELSARPGVAHVLTFENRGQAVGVSNPHPHGQIYATNFVYKTIQNERTVGRRHHDTHQRTLLQDIVDAELRDGERMLVENDSAVAFVPYFARYAYEAFVVPRAPHATLLDFTPGELDDFAAALREVTARYDNLWRMPFPYVMALHQAPCDGEDNRGFHFHVEFHPPLRRPNLLKHLAGPEIGGGGFLSDTSPEDKAAELRAVSSVHYSNVGSRPGA